MNEAKFLQIKKNQWSDNKKKLQKPFIINTSYGKTLTFILIFIFLLNIIIKERIAKI
jgi:hypothetical protein